MTKTIIKLLMVGGICGGLVGICAGEAKAWTAVPISGSYNVYGATVTDFFFGSVSAHARKRNVPERGQLDVTANVGSYTSSLSLWCTTGFQQQDKAGTNTVNGDILLTCAGAGLVTNAGGALQAN
jgi:hypothetical protein